MRGLPTLIRLHRWELDEKRRKLAELERLLKELENQSQRLERELQREQDVATEFEEGRHTYGAYVQGFIDRRDTLSRSIMDVQSSIAAARDEVAAAYEKVKTYELAEARYQERVQTTQARRERIQLDEVGLDMYRRRQQSA